MNITLYIDEERGVKGERKREREREREIRLSIYDWCILLFLAFLMRQYRRQLINGTHISTIAG